jgi:hypothetical protein
MSSSDASEAVIKLQKLSEERASKVLALINDLAELEVLEDADDLKDAREALAEIRSATAITAPSGAAQFANTADENVPTKTNGTVPYEQFRRELGLDG